MFELNTFFDEVINAIPEHYTNLDLLDKKEDKMKTIFIKNLQVK